MEKDSRIVVFGSSGMVGSAVVRKLQDDGYKNIITTDHDKLDLTVYYEVKYFMKKNNPEYVFNCAAKVGGIYANSTYPVEFLSENMMIGFNVVKYSYEYGIKKLLHLSSSCTYPKKCRQPIKEKYLMTKEL